MRDFNKNRIDTLSDVFCAWMGGIPENDNEIKYFLSHHEKLASLVNHRDIENIVHYNAAFPAEVVNAVYAIIPATVKLANGKDYAVFEGSFKRMNKAEIERFNGRVVSVDMSKAYKIYITEYADKARFMLKNYNKFKRRNERILFPDRQKEGYRRRRDAMSEEQKEEARKKSRENRRKWLSAHPEKKAEEAEKRRERQKKRNELRIISDRIASRINNRKYRENHRAEIRERRNNDRQRLKQENPQLQKELDRKNNARPGRKKINNEYYQRHKEEINQRARNNPKVKGYKKKYAVKKRWKEKTGPVVMSLLQALALHKQCDK